MSTPSSASPSPGTAPPPPYHRGFTSLEQTCENLLLPVRGRWPGWLRGSLLRTGPAKYEVGDRSYNHWFDGLAMLHRFAFTPAGVRYTNRFLESRSYCEAVKHGEIRLGEFATDPCRTLFQRFLSFFSRDLTDNGNVNVVRLGEACCAVTETRLPIRIAPATLQTLGPLELRQELSGPIASAHPLHDASRGLTYSYLIDFGYRSRYRLLQIDGEGQQTEVAQIAVDKPAYLHSFAMTERYLVLTEFPFVVHPLRLKFSGQPFIRNYRWEPDRGMRIHVIDKASGARVQQAVGPACFGFHHINAFEQGEAIVFDLIAYDDPALIDQLYLDRLRNAPGMAVPGQFTRFTLHPDGRVDRRVLFPEHAELPRFHEAQHGGRPYRYAYAAGDSGAGQFLDNLLKFDLQTQTTQRWHAAGTYPGEPVFVPAPEAAGEDQGVILSVVLEPAAETSFLLVLDAHRFQEIARAEVPHPIPFGFHGRYFADAP